MNKIISFIFLFILILFPLKTQAIEDIIVNETLKDKVFVKPASNLSYNYQSAVKIPVKLNITKDISTGDADIYDGKQVFFKVLQDVKYKNDILIKKGAVISAKIASYTTKGMSGVPACIIIRDFNTKGLDSEKFEPYYTKYGISFMPVVLPLKLALTFLPPLGSLTNFIPGTNAFIKTEDTITIYYRPEWNGREQP